MSKFEELVKVKGLLPITPNGRFALEVIEVKGKDFTIKADPKAPGNTLGITTFTITSPTLAELGVVAGSIAYLEPTSGEEAVGPWAIAYTAPEKPKVAAESAGQGRTRTPNFSVNRKHC